MGQNSKKPERPYGAGPAFLVCMFIVQSKLLSVRGPARQLRRNGVHDDYKNEKEVNAQDDSKGFRGDFLTPAAFAVPGHHVALEELGGQDAGAAKT